jgi:hypothetical protein
MIFGSKGAAARGYALANKGSWPLSMRQSVLRACARSRSVLVSIRARCSGLSGLDSPWGQ